jgi:predicted ATP-grasp superfamily ATP-dependent carboligase
MLDPLHPPEGGRSPRGSRPPADAVAAAGDARLAVLVTGGEHIGVLGAVRALREAGYAPWVAVHDRGGYAARSRAAAGVVEVPDPAADTAGFVRALAAAALRIPARVVLPGTEVGLAALSRHAHRFPAGVALGVCPPAVVADATDKGRLRDLAPAAGLSVPPTVELGLGDLRHWLPFPYPVVVKPHRSELATPAGCVRHFSARRVDSPAELRAALAAIPGARGLVQPYLDGPIGSLAGVYWQGEMVRAVQSIGRRVWPIHCGSTTWAETVPLDRRLVGSVGRLLDAIGWSGPYQVDFFERSGEFLIIDLNPRFYTSLALATRAGANLPGVWVELLCGRVPARDDGYRAGVRYRHDEDDVRVLLQMLRGGAWSAALRGLVPRRDTVHPVFSVRDPWPSLRSLSQLARRAGLRRRGKRGTAAGGEPAPPAHRLSPAGGPPAEPSQLSVPASRPSRASA